MPLTNYFVWYSSKQGPEQTATFLSKLYISFAFECLCHFLVELLESAFQQILQESQLSDDHIKE